jgi:nucleotide-binding universal stress UspA family protein
METIVVAADTSPGAMAAVEWAAYYAGERGARVVVVEAVSGMWMLDAIQINSDVVREQEHADVAQRICEPLRTAGVEHELVSRHGGTADALVETARDVDASLIVIGHTPSEHFAEHVLGSSVQRLLSRARRRPVVVVPAH